MIIRQEIEERIENLKKTLASGTAESIKTALDSLNKASHRLSEILYKAAGAQQAASGTAYDKTGDSPKPDTAQEGEVVDAEYEVHDENK